MVGYDFRNKPLHPKANADLRASTSLELHYINKDDLQQILGAYQKFEQYFMENFEPVYSICDEFEVRVYFLWQQCLGGSCALLKPYLYCCVFGDVPTAKI